MMPMSSSSRLLVSGSVLLAVLLPASAQACSTCMVGDPTQSLMGAEKPYEDRLRMSLDYLSRSEELGREGFNKKTIDEQRFSLSAAYAPSRRWMLGVSLPYVNRELESFNLSKESVSSIGDVTVTVKNFMQEKTAMQKHMYGFLGGLKLPTASEQTDASGAPLDFDVQAGQGATVLNAGGWYAHFNFPYLFYASASYHVASEGYQDFQAGDALTYNATAQYATGYSLSYYLGLEGRSSQSDTFDGVDDPDSGGTIVFAAPGIIYTVMTDLLINAVVKLPVVDALDGDHEEGTIISIGVTYDFQMH
jgi:hypothetical protein